MFGKLSQRGNYHSKKHYCARCDRWYLGPQSWSSHKGVHRRRGESV
ncbi:MAG: hypothetical protein KKB09_07135 [Nanoarchaeota archaeon]|nr:hypothetical protein [Nanoarchaeota archaeon]